MGADRKVWVVGRPVASIPLFSPTGSRLQFIWGLVICPCGLPRTKYVANVSYVVYTPPFHGSRGPWGKATSSQQRYTTLCSVYVYTKSTSSPRPCLSYRLSAQQSGAFGGPGSDGVDPFIPPPPRVLPTPVGRNTALKLDPWPTILGQIQGTRSNLGTYDASSNQKVPSPQRWNRARAGHSVGGRAFEPRVCGVAGLRQRKGITTRMGRRKLWLARRQCSAGEQTSNALY